MQSRTTFSLTWFVGLAAASGLACARAAAADLRWDDAKLFGAVSVRERPRTAFEPDGIRVGNFLLFPEVGYGVTWTGYQNAGFGIRDEDIRHELFTRLELQSQTPRHMLNILAQGRAVQYQDNEEIRYLDGGITTKWRLDIDHAHALFGTGSFNVRRLENVDDENPAGAAEPGQVTSYASEVGFRRQGSHIDAEVGLRYSRIEFADVKANDGSRIYAGWQDNSAIRPYVAMAWKASPGYRVFGEIAGSFQENTGTPTIDRDATAIEATAGVQFELSPLVRVTLKGGFVQQDYHQPNLIDISEPIWEGHLEWLVTPLVTMNLATWRSVRATQFGVASGQVVTGHSIRFDYEMWRNLIVSATASLRDLDYIGETREDRVLTAGLGFDYLHSKHWALGFSYEHQLLDSSIDAYDKQLDRIKFNVKYRF